MRKLKKKLMVAFASVAFATTAMNHRPDQLVAEGVQIPVERSCLTFSDFMKDPEPYRYETSYPSLMVFYNSASLGREMMDFVAKTDPALRLCDAALPRDVAARYQNGKISVDYSRDSSVTYTASYILHEMAHHYQAENGAQYYDSRRSMAGNQRAMLAMETAARVAELLALFSAAQAGSLDWQEDLKEHSQLRWWMEDLTARYDEWKSEGHDHDQALNEAARYMWQEVFRSQSILNHYNSSLIRASLLNTPRHARHWDATVDQTVWKAGRVGDKIDFTRPADMPRGAALFGTNDDLRQIFEAVEWYRSSRMPRANRAAIRAHKNRLIAAGNRFINVDFKAVAAQIRQGEYVEQAFKSAIEQKNAVSAKALPVTARKSSAA